MIRVVSTAGSVVGRGDPVPVEMWWLEVENPMASAEGAALLAGMKTLRATSTVEYEVPNHCQVPVLPFGEDKHVLTEGEVWQPALRWRRCEEVFEQPAGVQAPPGFVEKKASSKLQWVKTSGNGKKRRERIRRRLAKKGG